MEKFGHWVVDGPPHNQIVWSGPETRICFLAHSAGIDDERDIAIGRLIAAAPELVEALKPFAAFVTAIEGLSIKAFPDTRVAWGFDGIELKWGDFRKAAAALSRAGVTS